MSYQEPSKLENQCPIDLHSIIISKPGMTSFLKHKMTVSSGDLPHCIALHCSHIQTIAGSLRKSGPKVEAWEEAGGS